MKEGAEKAAQEAGAELQSFAGEKDGDNESQVAAIESLIASEADGVLITAIDPVAIAPTIQKARDAGQLVIALDPPTDPPDAVDQTFATDNFLLLVNSSANGRLLNSVAMQRTRRLLMEGRATTDATGVPQVTQVTGVCASNYHEMKSLKQLEELLKGFATRDDIVRKSVVLWRDKHSGPDLPPVGLLADRDGEQIAYFLLTESGETLWYYMAKKQRKLRTEKDNTEKTCNKEVLVVLLLLADLATTIPFLCFSKKLHHGHLNAFNLIVKSRNSLHSATEPSGLQQVDLYEETMFYVATELIGKQFLHPAGEWQSCGPADLYSFGALEVKFLHNFLSGADEDPLLLYPKTTASSYDGLRYVLASKRDFLAKKLSSIGCGEIVSNSHWYWGPVLGILKDLAGKLLAEDPKQRASCLEVCYALLKCLHYIAERIYDRRPNNSREFGWSAETPFALHEGRQLFQKDRRQSYRF